MYTICYIRTYVDQFLLFRFNYSFISYTFTYVTILMTNTMCVHIEDYYVLVQFLGSTHNPSLFSTWPSGQKQPSAHPLLLQAIEELQV